MKKFGWGDFGLDPKSNLIFKLYKKERNFGLTHFTFLATPHKFIFYLAMEKFFF